jgi:hypothetical protein
MHESHDEPDWSQINEADREFVAQIFKGLEDRVKLLERRLGSSPPGTLEINSPTHWRVKAPAGYAVAIAVLALLGVLAWKFGASWKVPGVAWFPATWRG